MKTAILILAALTLSACETKRIVTALEIPPERIDCTYIAGRPNIPPEYAIDWAKVKTVAEAKGEHDRFVARVRDREGVIAGYIVKREGELFACSSDAEWMREWSKAQNP